MSAIPLPVRLLRQRLLSLLDALPAATSGDAASVHKARVASRRLRAVLPVLAEAADSNALDRASRQVRKITRALGPIRELDVAIGHLDELGPESGASLQSVAAVRSHLSTERTARRRAMLEIITPAALLKLKSQLHVHPHERPPVSEDDVELRGARRRALRRARALLNQMQRAGGLYEPERLHAVRVAAKKLRYALEVERELTRSRAVARINRLKRLQDRLGEIHDYEILLMHVREVQAAMAGTNLRQAAELDKLIRVLEQRCREGHAGFLRQRPALTSLCEATIEAASAPPAEAAR